MQSILHTTLSVAICSIPLEKVKAKYKQIAKCEDYYE